jgi:hypothetical protein
MTPETRGTRHVVNALVGVALAVIAVTFALQLLPHAEIPEWVRAIVRTKKFWLPVLIGSFVVAAELKRRRNKVSRDDDRA